MALEGLKAGIFGAIGRLKGKRKLDQAEMKELSKSIRRALLEAAFNVRQSKEITARLEERMIEEELLIKRAIDLGMLENNPMARGTIVQQMIKTIISENDRYEIPDQDLINFFEENIGFFTKSQRLRLQQIYFSNEEFSNSSQKKAQEAYEMLIDGEAFSKVSNLGSKSALRIPNTLMTLSKVREYIGPSLMNLARNLEAGSFSEPVAVSGGYKIIYLFEKELIEPPSFRSIEDSVRAEYSKRMDDKSLRDYLENLKNWYDISRNPPK